MESCARVDAVVVTYYPDLALLGGLLRALAPQVGRIHVVDNTPVGDTRLEIMLAESSSIDVRLIRLGTNMGIAKALNEGINAARDCGATHVLLSDQDSLPAPDMVSALLRTWNELRTQGIQVGVVGPTFTDINTGLTSPFQASVPGKFFYGHLRPDVGRPVVEALTLITSGSLLPLAALDDVGPMREDFFIDHVDIEWCHRARARGWKLFGTGAATMFHRMGDASLRVWYFGWRQESAYSPLRMYYRMRNFVSLCRSPAIDARWKLRNAWYWLGFVYSHAVFGPQKRGSVRMALRGLSDGLRGRLGPWRD